MCRSRNSGTAVILTKSQQGDVVQGVGEVFMNENIADPDLSPDIKWMEENPFSKIPPVWFSLLPPIMKTKQEGQ